MSRSEQAGPRGHMVGGVVVLALAAAAALEAMTFDVAFPTDPLGPKAFPLLSAFLLAFGGFALIGRGRELRQRGGALPASGPASPDAAPRAASVALATLAFVAYALLLAPLGFVVATTAAFAALVRLFDGPLGRGALAGLGFSLLLYALFVYALGLPLPLGVLAR